MSSLSQPQEPAAVLPPPASRELLRPPRPEVAAGDGRIEIEGLSKTFGPRKVLDSFRIAIDGGTVHGLLGANGSGKSTAIKILAGYHDPDDGEGTLMAHDAVHRFPLAHAERRAIGLAFVHQDLGLAGETSVAENLFIDDLASNALARVGWRALHMRASSLLDRVGGGHIDPRATIHQLMPVDRAIVAIARAFSELRPGGLLVLDEVTTFLPRDSVEFLFNLVREVCAAGMSVLFVSHRLEEVRALCTSATVLRGGVLVGCRDIATTPDDQLVTDIVGDELSAMYPPKHAVGSATKLVVRDVRSRGMGPISFEAKAGEIVGVTGLRGMGHEHLPYALYAAVRSTGTVELDDQALDLHRSSVRDLLKAGARLVPSDRLRQGAVPAATVQENTTLPYIAEFFRSGTLRRRSERIDTQALLDDYGVVPADPGHVYSGLSGGNQQKVLMARCLRLTPALLLLDEPTQGVDVGARRELFARIVRAAESGTTVIYVSTETQDLAELCHRVLIFRDGRIVDTVEEGDVSEESILRACWLNDGSREPVPAH